MEKTGTFLVIHAEADSAVLQDVEAGQVHPLSSNPGVEERDVLEATVTADPPLEVTWSVVDVAERRTVAVERVDEPPSDRARSLAADEPGSLVTDDDGDPLHVLTVPEGGADDAAAEVVADQATLERAARLGASRVEVRGDGTVVSVRYR